MERTSFWRSLNTRERWGWVIYDWADSAFVLCVITVIGAGYFVHMFEKSAQEAGTLMVGSAPALPFAGLNLTGEGAWSLLVGLSAFIVAVSSPIMGAIADAGKLRLRFLVGYCLIGVLATLTLAFPLPWWAIGLAILIGNVGYEGGNVYYNSFLPDIGTAKEQDALSSAGYAFGYLGGVLVLIAALFLFVLPPDGEIRNSFLLVGLWWGGFALFTFTWVRESPVKQTTPPVHQISHAWQEVKRTLRLLTQSKDVGLFLVAFLLYNDGIATLISNATPYALQNIYLDDTLTQHITLKELTPVIIMIQVIGFPGSIFTSWMSSRIGEKPTIYFTLAVYAAVVTYGQVAKVLWEFYIMAALIGLVLGGSQAISRSLFSSLVPRGKNAEFFAFFALSSKFSAMIGPLVYGGLVLWTGETRPALLSLTFFFLTGGVLLYFVDVKRGQHQSA